MICQFFIKGLGSNIILIDVFSTLNFYYAYFLSRLASLFNKRYVLVLRGGNLPNRYKRSIKKVTRIFENATEIIAPSQYLQSYFEKEGFEIQNIPNIIELEQYDFRERHKINPKILYLRGFSKIYNPQMTVKAISMLIRKYPAVRLSMLGSDYGDGTLREIENLTKELHLQEHVSIIGQMTRNEWVNYSKEFDIMVSNPIIDNTPVSIIEGMALGLLIVSTEVGGINYLLTDEENALLVPSNDHEKLSEAIELLLTNPELCARLQNNARKKAETFSWENIKPQWEEVLCNQPAHSQKK
jgi:glycosyltransferase involved in cell wall biosynthesis